MAIAFVRDTGKVTGENVSSLAASFSSLPAVGNFVAFGGSYYSPGGSSTFADNQSNSYTHHRKTPGGGTTEAFLAFTNVTGSSGTFTGTVTPGAGSYITYSGAEFSGIVTSSPRDVTYDNGAQSSTSSPVNSGNSSATSQADELVLSVLNLDGSGPFTGLAASGYTSIHAEPSGAIQAGAFGYKIVSATGQQSASWAWTGGASTDGWAVIIDTFKASLAASQFSRPSSDITDGSWTTDSGGTSLFAAIDETPASDTDYIKSATISDNSSDTCEVALQSLSDPVASTGHVVRYRYRKTNVSGTSKAMNLTVKLMQGTTEIASWTHSNISTSYTDAAQTLTGPQADAITNYADLRLRFTATGA